MKRTGFARKVYVAPPAAPLRRSERPGVYAYAGELTAPIAKMDVCRSEAYRRLVAALPCKHCGISGYSQAAHPNTNKGSGIKTSDLDCFPLCTVHPGADADLVRGCHERFDQGGLFSKAVRRAIEPVWAADTRRHIEAAGMWPANLPQWIEA